MTIHKGQFVSVWEEGTVQTTGTYDDHTGEVTSGTVDTGDLGSLEREYFEYQNQKHQACEVEICTTCHSYITTAKMIPDQVGKGLSEVQVCSNPDCESNQ